MRPNQMETGRNQRHIIGFVMKHIEIPESVPSEESL